MTTRDSGFCHGPYLSTIKKFNYLLIWRTVFSKTIYKDIGEVEDPGDVITEQYLTPLREILLESENTGSQVTSFGKNSWSVDERCYIFMCLGLRPGPFSPLHFLRCSTNKCYCIVKNSRLCVVSPIGISFIVNFQGSFSEVLRITSLGSPTQSIKTEC